MAKSTARKQRDKKLQQGGMDPTMQRGNWNGVKPVTRVKPDKRKYAYPKNDDDRGFKRAGAA
ncbi:hypothetical protein [Paenibacillus sp. CF384]|uniref:hypothetical protein n=1 Tax=Paenibacillus sp. CF384 TaxID=1884382 RepID=UPI000895205B|nr:hypothetical protein [Paenibacillus sp. CF384]SDX72470.1 hypothetical protein SAMN05518855_1019137 [Paenibacillus sp. CF384]